MYSPKLHSAPLSIKRKTFLATNVLRIKSTCESKLHIQYVYMYSCPVYYQLPIGPIIGSDIQHFSDYLPLRCSGVEVKSSRKLLWHCHQHDNQHHRLFWRQRWGSKMEVERDGTGAACRKTRFTSLTLWRRWNHNNWLTVSAAVTGRHSHILDRRLNIKE